MKICCISDPHSYLPEIPECDLLLISGDICPDTSPIPEYSAAFSEVIHRPRPGTLDAMWYQSEWLKGPFRKWLDEVPAKNIVACWGNHDFIGERQPELVPSDLRWKLLTDSLIEINGLKIFGSPWQNWFYDWAFNAPEGPDGEIFLAKKYAQIPDDTDIIISHGPPKGFGDKTMDGQAVGSVALLEAIKRIRPQLVVCGHIHNGAGVYHLPRGNKSDCIIANASVVNERYELVRGPVILDIEPEVKDA